MIIMSKWNLLQKLQLTLAIIKPDVVAHPHRLKEVKQLILNNNFYFVRSQERRLQRKIVEQFYAEHKGRFFFNRLVGFMSSGPISVHILAREDAIAKWREAMGPTKTFRAKHEVPDSIRARFGLTDTRNATHGSDSAETARKEMTFFFPDFDIDDWYQNQEPSFRTGQVTFCERRTLHYVAKMEIENR
ncbi:nucleoside diphosphate kinase 6-like [Patiria miniata]|uniref:Nucleoside diphosphate kinase-like domain-containing protein n=1 Tax=Patiria miniata TaxID=46514 RepID=A0A914A1X9_PATMI|nr:nucleoside diphosphate kinase 6-like [Patiria miniata]